ncbi:hypothetical protein [Larsenimonas rhizosphaerae]|uniref:Uncharacterized protein n=1 Tax=Larsenimonas rhizosphaerae TaxID=2944682 RepID=A0AA42CX04_9GAMM|nr:hypothetical protein [Larsenimonas rhizosphaerae]MCM2130594.1 hypothetical protein [Larsenimonas rhizosphaerae]MCX2523298.1 hypothetical protein [Larsenimonas rhizosphaerae]
MRNLLTIVLSGALLAATATHAVASTATRAQEGMLNASTTGENVEVLKQGWSDTRMATQGHPNQFLIHVSQPQTIVLSSSHFAGDHGDSYRLSAKVFNEQRELVATAINSDGGNFKLSQPLAAGDYLVQVNGQTLHNENHTDASYQLHLDRL